MNLIDRLQQSALQNSSAPAFIHDGKVVCYRDLHALLCATVKVLHENGIRPGTVVGITIPHPLMHVIIMLALARLGAVFISIHHNFVQSRREKLVAKYNVSTVVSISN